MIHFQAPARIVFFGVRGSGKSTLSDELVRVYGYHADAFANPLKRVCAEIFGFSEEDLYGTSRLRDNQYPGFENTGWCFSCHAQCTPTDDTVNPWKCINCGEVYPKYISPRHALKTLGTEWGRRICIDIWANALFQKAPSLLVISDGRFRNENAICVRQGAIRVLLTRGLAESTDPHPSEAEVREQAKDPVGVFDLIINNADMTLAATKGVLHSYIRRICYGRGKPPAHALLTEVTMKDGVLPPISK